MCVALIGGMDRLERHYMKETSKHGISLKVFTRLEKQMTSKIKNVDAVVILTNEVSHQAKTEVTNVAKAKNIPVFMYYSCEGVIYGVRVNAYF